MLTKHRAEEQGFTVVELLVVILVASIIGAFTVSSLVQGFRVSNDADRRIEALTELQRSGQRIARELRMACHVRQADPDAVVIDLLRDDETFRYGIDVDADGDLRIDVDRVHADAVTTTDIRDEHVANDIVNGDALFAYADADGGAPSSLSAIRDVAVTLQREVADDVVEWTADLHLRNGGLSCGF